VGARERGRGRIEGAVRLLGAAAALRERLGAAATPSASVTLPIVTHEEYGRQVVAARTALGAPAFERAWSAGVLLSLDDALDEALATTAPELRSWAAAPLSPPTRRSHVQSEAPAEQPPPPINSGRTISSSAPDRLG
jgi:hypothetical protein